MRNPRFIGYASRHHRGFLEISTRSQVRPTTATPTSLSRSLNWELFDLRTADRSGRGRRAYDFPRRKRETARVLKEASAAAAPNASSFYVFTRGRSARCAGILPGARKAIRAAVSIRMINHNLFFTFYQPQRQLSSEGFRAGGARTSPHPTSGETLLPCWRPFRDAGPSPNCSTCTLIARRRSMARARGSSRFVFCGARSTSCRRPPPTSCAARAHRARQRHP